MYTKKYIINDSHTLYPEYHTIETEVSFDGDRFFIYQKDKDTGHSIELTLSEEDAWDLKIIIEEILAQG